MYMISSVNMIDNVLVMTGGGPAGATSTAILYAYDQAVDFMDYGYILAEELVIRGEYYDAFLLLEQIIKMEYSYQYFYIFC